MFRVPAALALALALLSVFVPRVSDNAALALSFQGAAATLLLWLGTLMLRLRASGGVRFFEVALRRQHWVQALVQMAVFAYWGWWWRPIYDFVPLLAGQLLFAYGFDMLLAWSRHDSYRLGFGPFPIIFSTNLFLWFRDDWFALQFLMIAVGFMGKELVRWNRDGRRTHIFNPSAFSLGLFSLVLIATGTTDLSWAEDIATTLGLAPRIYLVLFLLGLVVMDFFSITLVAGSAAVVLFAASALWRGATGVPYFVDSEIPPAVFLGLHLLVTDPSTSPRTPLGKAIFGTLYGLGVFALYALLGALGAPTFYDKLLCVPLLNLSVQWIDALAGRIERIPAVSRWGESAPLRSNRVHMAVWALVFGTMAALGRTDGTQPGDRLPFWQQACAEERRGACDRLLAIESSYCSDNSAWACNELGRHYREGTIVPADDELALRSFSVACELRFLPACLNLLDEGEVRRAEPKTLDFRLLLREGGANLMEMPESELRARACRHGWDLACAEGE